MTIVRPEQMSLMARARFVERLDTAFLRDVPGFSECEPEDRHMFLAGTISLGESKGLSTEQGLASYALALWWLGVDFEAKSAELESLMQSTYPEVRKVQAMNEWVNAMIGDPGNVAAADQALKRGLSLTGPWGPPR